MSAEAISNFFTHLQWSDDTEQLLANWADIATCYTWLFDKAYRRNDKINFYFSLPVIILSTVTGTLVMSLDSLLPTEYVNIGQKALGGITICTGILSTLQNHFRHSQKAESCLQASLGWSKFERNIKIQLSLNRKYRKNVEEFTKECRLEYERLLEVSPIIEENSIKLFKNNFKELDIIRPEILDKIEKTNINKDKPLLDILELQNKIEENINDKDKIKVKIIELSEQNNISQRQIIDNKITVQTPQDPSTELDDIIVEPVIRM
jgi:predicted XRE-type DNA-binding protein